MSNLYHRKLLTDFDVSKIDALLDEAIVYIGEQKRSLTESQIHAVLTRLKLRKCLLTAVILDIDVKERYQIRSWEQCLALLPSLSKTKNVGVAVESSFSAKIQRRLASSVPPRPVVNICFEDAVAYLTRLCQNGIESYRILDYHGSSNILVGPFWNPSERWVLTSHLHRHLCHLSSHENQILQYTFVACYNR